MSALDINCSEFSEKVSFRHQAFINGDFVDAQQKKTFENINPATGDAKAIAIANDSVYGLTASVWTNNLKRAHRLSKKFVPVQIQSIA